MKTKWLASLILASAVTAPAFAQVGIYIGHEPPPLRYEVRPAMPGAGYAWCAAEASVAARLRKILVDDKAHDRHAIRAAAYWKRGAVAHHANLDE